MRARDLAGLWVAALVLAGCGADGGSGNSLGSGMAYDFVTPVLNSMRTYGETVIDNSNNTIDIGYTQSVTAVNAGAATELLQSTTGNSTIVNGTNYAIITETQNFNDIGQETRYVYTAAGGSLVTCTFDPHGDGPDWPLKVGQTWAIDYTLTCGTAAPVTYSQMGSVVDVESVTVPAGTYTAIKLQSTLTWTNSDGTTRTQTIENWRDVATSDSVKQEISIAVSGTPPATGYAVSREILLESTS